MNTSAQGLPISRLFTLLNQRETNTQCCGSMKGGEEVTPSCAVGVYGACLRCLWQRTELKMHQSRSRSNSRRSDLVHNLEVICPAGVLNIGETLYASKATGREKRRDAAIWGNHTEPENVSLGCCESAGVINTCANNLPGLDLFFRTFSWACVYTYIHMMWARRTRMTTKLDTDGVGLRCK